MATSLQLLILFKKKSSHRKDYRHFLKNENPNSFFIKPTSEAEIVNLINELDSKKSTGPNSVPNFILKLIKFEISKPLKDIINLSFNKGKYIDILKISKVTPIFKEKGDELEVSNYRPISLLSNFNKIFEKIMHERVVSFLDKHNCIYNRQFGFRKGHSTTHTLIDLTESIRRSIDNNSYAVGIFLDFQKAFDTVEHSILLQKLKHYGIRGVTNKWFESYLSNRKQFVSISNQNSNFETNKYGVPQGSVLGPLLFIIYINDLHNAINFSTTRHFADDTNLLLTNKSLKKINKQLNLDLKALNSWLRANKISLNRDKTEMVIFKHPNKHVNYKLKIKIDGKIISPSKFTKYLGVYLDENLNWNHHVRNLTPKLTRALSMLKKVRHYIPSSDCLRNVYFGIFSSILHYGSQIWGQYSNIHIKRVIKLHHKAIRVINFAHNNANIKDLLVQSNILDFKDEIKLSNFLFVRDSITGNIPKCLQNLFKYSNEVHNHNTRHTSRHSVTLPKSKTLVYGIHSITDQAARAWNSLQISLHNINFINTSRKLCKNKLNTIILQSYMQ